MPLPLIGVAAVGTVAAVSYLGPLIIACIVGAATTISSFLMARKIYKKKEKSDLSNLKKEQMKRERKTRKNAEQLAKQVEDNVTQILSQSKQQQERFGSSIQNFNTNIDATNQATVNLERVAESMEHVASTTTITVETMTAELDRLKEELISVTATLKMTQEALIEKEKEFAITVDKLVAIEMKMATDTRESSLHLTKFTEELSHSHDLLSHTNNDSQLKDSEVALLRDKNIRLTSTIKTLEKTMEQLSSKLADSTDVNNARLKEIKILLHEIKRLTSLIDDLSNALENKGPSPATEEHRSSSTHKLRMFTN